MNSVVDIKDVKLKTPVVTIQAMTVSGKQMTLAVFRQLPVANWTNLGDPWGFVNYSIKGQGDVWLVFSHKGVLWRRTMKCRKPVHNLQHREEQIGILAQAAADYEQDKEKFEYRMVQGLQTSCRYGNAASELAEEKQWYESAKANHDKAFEEYTYDKSLRGLPQLFIAV